MTLFESTVKLVATPISIIIWIYAATIIFNIALLLMMCICFSGYALAKILFANLSTLLPILS